MGFVHPVSTHSAHSAHTPKALPAALALVVFAVVATWLASLADGPDTTVTVQPLSTHAVAFQDRSDGAVVVTFPDAAPARDPVVLAAGTHNFIRGVMRGLARERKARDIGPTTAFRLIQWADGRLELEDPATRRRIPLESFGPTNLAEFRALIKATPDA